MFALKVDHITGIGVEKLIVIADGIGLVGPVHQVVLHLLKTQQVAGTVVGKANTNRVHQRENNKHPHTGYCGENVAMGVEFLVHEHKHR